MMNIQITADVANHTSLTIIQVFKFDSAQSNIQKGKLLLLLSYFCGQNISRLKETLKSSRMIFHNYL